MSLTMSSIIKIKISVSLILISLSLPCYSLDVQAHVQGKQNRCDNGDGLACYDLGLELAAGQTITGEKIAKDFFKATKLYKKACDAEILEACYFLGYSYSNGEGVRQDYFKSTKLYQKACNGGNVAGCLGLGINYTQGKGIRQNYTKARELFQKICRAYA